MKIAPADDMSYFATSYIIPASNGLPAVDVTANDPQGWVQQQLDKRDPNTRLGQIETEKQREDAVIQDIRRQMQELLKGTGSKISGAASGAAGGVSDAISSALNPLDGFMNIAKGAGIMLVLVLVGVLLLAFGIYQLTKD